MLAGLAAALLLAQVASAPIASAQSATTEKVIPLPRERPLLIEPSAPMGPTDPNAQGSDPLNLLQGLDVSPELFATPGVDLSKPEYELQVMARLIEDGDM